MARYWILDDEMIGLSVELIPFIQSPPMRQILMNEWSTELELLKSIESVLFTTGILYITTMRFDLLAHQHSRPGDSTVSCSGGTRGTYLFRQILPGC